MLQIDFAYAIMPIEKRKDSYVHKGRTPGSNANTSGGSPSFYGEVNRLGCVTDYSSPSNHLHR